jgi:hypothetical protein
MPERSSSAGVSSAPHATTTCGAFTVTRRVSPVSGFVYVAATPVARPSLLHTWSALVSARMVAPWSTASRR